MLVQVGLKRRWIEAPTVEFDLSAVIAGGRVVEKAAHEDVMEQPRVHDAECIVVVLADLADNAGMICSGA